MINKHAVLLLISVIVSFLLQFIPVSSLYYDPTIYHGTGYTLVMGQGGGSLPKEHSVTLFNDSYSYVPSTAWHYTAMVLNYLNIVLVFAASFGTKRRGVKLVLTYVVAGIWIILAALFLLAPFIDVRELSASPLSYFGIGGQAMLDNAKRVPSYIAVALALSAFACALVAANSLKQEATAPNH